jgi:hypothetical protein
LNNKEVPGNAIESVSKCETTQQEALLQAEASAEASAEKPKEKQKSCPCLNALSVDRTQKLSVDRTQNQTLCGENPKTGTMGTHMKPEPIDDHHVVHDMMNGTMLMQTKIEELKSKINDKTSGQEKPRSQNPNKTPNMSKAK